MFGLQFKELIEFETFWRGSLESTARESRLCEGGSEITLAPALLALRQGKLSDSESKT